MRRRHPSVRGTLTCARASKKREEMRNQSSAGVARIKLDKSPSRRHAAEKWRRAYVLSEREGMASGSALEKPALMPLLGRRSSTCRQYNAASARYWGR